jgi:hypothetical protein
LLQRADTGAAGWCTAEILRARADALLAAGSPVSNDAAESVLIRALKRSTRGPGLELRSATSLARLWQRQGRYRQAHELLAPIYQRFTEGYATPDLIAVRRLLGELQEHLPA